MIITRKSSHVKGGLFAAFVVVVVSCVFGIFARDLFVCDAFMIRDLFNEPAFATFVLFVVVFGSIYLLFCVNYIIHELEEWAN